MSDAPRQLPPKKEVALALLQRENSVFVHIDPRREGVLVPKWLTKQAQLTLQIGMNMPIPIADLKVEDDGISCTLSFQRTPFWCRMPWNAVWALVGESQRGMVWPEDVPPEVAQQQAGAAQKPAKKPRPHLAAVGSGGEVARASERQPQEDGGAALAVEEGGAAVAREESESSGSGASQAAGEPKLSVVGGEAAEETSAAAGEDAAETGAPEGEERSEPAEERAPQGARPGGGKPKRELPPYLRVIK
ncbi:ClpXP protease specificity-enhancing factor SspB [Chondromyces crocatus]|nr:ClpXP protease specificity-enhancing factor SspB [Chondromyces crocatus]